MLAFKLTSKLNCDDGNAGARLLQDSANIKSIRGASPLACLSIGLI